MCGIAGCIGDTDNETVNRMLDALPHRGPNDRGIHECQNMVFGHTRLSIVDVAMGHQPILANGGSAGIICNGEIYNFRELRKALTPEFCFKTKSDSEVILHSYQKKGPECVKDLHGMFAFAVWESDRRRLSRLSARWLGLRPNFLGWSVTSLACWV